MANTKRRPFQQNDPSKGNFQAYKNLRTSSRSNPPDFTGTVTLPGTNEQRSFSLWARRARETGNLVLSGPASASRERQWNTLGAQQYRNPDEGTKYVKMGDDRQFGIRADQIVLFTSPEKPLQEGKKAPPKMFGYFNPGGDHPIMTISAFEHADRNNNIMLLGPVEVYDPNKSYDQDNNREENSADEPDPDPSDFDNPFGDLTQTIPEHMLPQKQSGRDRASGDPQR